MSTEYFFCQNNFKSIDKVWQGMLSDFEDKPIKFLEITNDDFILEDNKQYDLIYIKGSNDLFSNALIASSLIAPKGCLIFNNYRDPLNMKTINNFIDMLEPSKWRIAGNWYQMFLRKSFNPNRTDIWDFDF